jgi:hypothetical protein
MAAIAHAFTEQNTAQTTTGTAYGDVTGASIASGSFVAGKKYLIFITAQVSNNTAGEQVGLIATHGTTDFAESELVFDVISANERATYGWFTVWTAVSGEGIKLRFKASAGTSAADQIAIFAMNLSDNLTENTDWFFNERATDDALTATPVVGASITFTPETASQDWLVLSYAQVDPTATNTTPESSLQESVGGTTTPSAGYEVADATGIIQYPLARVFSLSAASHQFNEVSISESSTHTRLHSSMFILNLNKFKNHANAYTDAGVTLSTTDYATQLQTISITPDVAGDVWMGAYWTFVGGSTIREGEFRVQLDGSDQPAGQTTDNYQFDYGNDATDVDPVILTTLASLTAAAHTIDLDASSDGATGIPQGGHRTLWAVTMELPPESINAQPGSYSVSGAVAGLLGDSLVNAAPGAYSVIGQAITPDIGLNAALGAYAVAGANAGLLVDALLSADPGVYVFTGSAAELVRGVDLVAEPGVYVLTGADAEFVVAIIHRIIRSRTWSRPSGEA